MLTIRLRQATRRSFVKPHNDDRLRRALPLVRDGSAHQDEVRGRQTSNGSSFPGAFSGRLCFRGRSQRDPCF
jgi:hypothetical protein